MQAMSQLIYDVLESKRKNIPDTPNYIFYRRLLVWIIMVPMLGVSVIECLAFTRGGLLFDLTFNSDKILKGQDKITFTKGLLASGIDINAWTLYVYVFLTLTMNGIIFWFIKPKTEAGIKKAIWWLATAIGIGEVLIAYASLTYGGYQAGIVGLGFTSFTFIVGLIIGFRRDVGTTASRPGG